MRHQNLIDNNFLTIASDMFFIQNCSVFYLLSIDTKIDTFCRIWIFIDRKNDAIDHVISRASPQRPNLWISKLISSLIEFQERD